jgi:ABC-type antimicrobial peptide transport system permease subunit
MKKNLKIGLLGFGAMGKTHAFSVASLPFYFEDVNFSASYTAVCTAGSNSAKSASEKYSVGYAADNEDAIHKLVELSYSDPETTDILFEMQNAVMYTLGTFNEIIEVLAKVFVWVGLALALFSSFLLMNFISTSISYKRREIGILRAVGARSSDVFKIFFSEAFIIAFINFVLASAASITAVLVLNSYMRSQGINITLLSFGPLQMALMLAISVAVAAIGAFLPVYKIAHKKPVDAIKDR